MRVREREAWGKREFETSDRVTCLQFSLPLSRSFPFVFPLRLSPSSFPAHHSRSEELLFHRVDAFLLMAAKNHQDCPLPWYLHGSSSPERQGKARQGKAENAKLTAERSDLDRRKVHSCSSYLLGSSPGPV